MIEVREVKTKKEIRDFILFPIKLYKGNKYYVPELYGDVKKLMGDKNPNNIISKSVFFIAYDGKKVVGRIQGIIQYQSNEKTTDRKVRFTRMHFINDVEVAKALFKALEEWARDNGLDTIVGPLGYNDLEREGLLIEGFEELSTFEEEYNYPYYGEILEKIGFTKDVDWLEFKLRAPKENNLRLEQLSDYCMKINKLHVAPSKGISKKQYINKYRDGFFHVLDESYSKLYETVPISKQAQESLIKQFMQIINKKYLIFICDENDEVVAFALCFPSLSKAVLKSNGKLTPIRIFKILHAVNHPKVIDLGLVGVLPEYQKKGLTAVVLNGLMSLLKQKGMDHAETNLNLETNTNIISQWKYFDSEQHKKRRAYIKKIGD